MITFQRSTADDIGHLDQLHDMIRSASQNSLMAYKSHEELISELTNSQAILALEANNVIGYCAYKVWASGIELMSLIVQPDYRARGIGSSLLTELRNKAWCDYPGKELLVLSNSYSTSIVERLGFIPIEKLSLSEELQAACQGCPEYPQFPKCHCQAHIYPSATAIYIETLDYSNEPDVQSLAEMFCEIWKEPPWCEFFWTVTEVREYILSFAKLPKGSWLVMKNRGKIIGFAAGYEVDSLELSQISGHSETIWTPLFSDKRGFYVAEIAVNPSYRGKHLGTALAITQMNYAKLKSQSYMVFRTKNVITEHLYQALGFVRSPLVDGADPERKYWYKMLDAKV